MSFAWKHLSAASFLCGGVIAQISVTVSPLPPLLELAEKLLNMLNTQKLLLSRIRLMTGFFWAGCHQLQLEPEMLIKPSLLGFFFILIWNIQTPSWLLSTSSSTFMLPCPTIPWSAAAQGEETLPESCFILCCSGWLCTVRGWWGKPLCSALAGAHQIYLQSLELMSTTGFVVSNSCLAGMRTNGFIQSSSKTVQIRVTSWGGCISSPSLEMGDLMKRRKPTSTADAYTHSVCQTLWI